MGFIGFIKDIALLPIEAVLDISGITPMIRANGDKPFESDQPFGTIDRLKSMVNNLDETRK